MAQITHKGNTGDHEFTEKFKEIVRANGIETNVSEVIVNDAGLKGEGYGSVTLHVTIKFEDSQIKPLNLFVKKHTTNASHSEMLHEVKAFEKETRFLTEYVPAVEEMCKRKGFEGFVDFYPKCYYGDENMIVLENLVIDKGYQLIDKSIRQDFEAAKFAIKTLAKHHAMSYVMIKEIGGPRNFFEKFPLLDYEVYDKPFIINLMAPVFENSIDSNMKILEKSGINGALEIAAKLKSFKGKPLQILNDLLKKKDEERLLFLGHGDYWNNNMMFLRDKETQEIIHHKAIDFQVGRYNSAAIDLSQYIFTSVRMEARQKHTKELLEIYMGTLNNVSNDFGHPLTITYEQLFLEYRRKFKFGFWIGFNMAVGPGMALLANVDINKVDVKDWAVVLETAVDKWINENPEECLKIAQELILLFKEYDGLEIIED